MNYRDETKTYAPEASPTGAGNSLTADTSRLVDYLAETLGRIRKIGDGLVGPEPRDVVKAEPPRPIVTVRSNVDDAHSLTLAISDELRRVESKL